MTIENEVPEWVYRDDPSDPTYFMRTMGNLLAYLSSEEGQKKMRELGRRAAIERERRFLDEFLRSDNAT